MKAIVHTRYGPPELLEFRDDVPRPDPADDGLLVRVRAASVNAGDWRQVRASPALIRLGNGIRRPSSGAVGVDVAGVVESVGSGRSDLQPGDAVFGMVPKGAFAEYVTGGWFVRKPERLTFEQAAAVPAAACTALQAVRDHGRVQAGQRVLVHGAGGGVGTFVVQIAKSCGAEVTATSRPASLDLLRAIGADQAIDYTTGETHAPARGYDVVIDLSGRMSVAALGRALVPGGMLVLVGAGHGPGGPVTRLVGGQLRRRLRGQRVAAFLASPTGFVENLTTLAALIEAGSVTPVVARTFPLSETADAIRYLESGQARGKVVITM